MASIYFVSGARVLRGFNGHDQFFPGHIGFLGLGASVIQGFSCRLDFHGGDFLIEGPSGVRRGTVCDRRCINRVVGQRDFPFTARLKHRLMVKEFL